MDEDEWWENEIEDGYDGHEGGHVHEMDEA